MRKQLLSISDDGDICSLPPNFNSVTSWKTSRLHNVQSTALTSLSLLSYFCGHIQKEPQHSSTGRLDFQSYFVSISTYFLTQAHIQRLLFETPYEFLFKKGTATLFLNVVHTCRTLLDLKKAWFSFLESNQTSMTPPGEPRRQIGASEQSIHQPVQKAATHSSLWPSAPLA